MTHCTQLTFDFHLLKGRRVTGRFDAPAISSDGGGLLLREIDKKLGLIEMFAACFDDHRSPRFTTHSLKALLSQRIFGIALGYEDLNDHEQLRHDPLMAVLAGKPPEEDAGFDLAGKSTLNRLELTQVRASHKSRYKKIVARHGDIEDFFVKVFLRVHHRPPKRIVLDIDATDDPLHGHQSGRFFHGYYKSYCYLPLYIFAGSHLLCAKLRPSNIDAAAGTVKQLDRIVKQIRAQWPKVKIVIRGDSGFCRDRIMNWCESNQVDYILGLAKNHRLSNILKRSLQQAEQQFYATGKPARCFKDFRYRTVDSWSRTRRVVGKAEFLPKGANPRFVVTSLSSKEFAAESLYEQEYCARGEMENRIKEQQLYLFADRTSASTMRANQLRLWLSSVAYVLVNALREFGLKGTELEKSQCHTIRLKLFKIGATIRVTVRRVWISLSAGYPFRATFDRVLENLKAMRSLNPSPG
jgi:hypothetical protein